MAAQSDRVPLSVSAKSPNELSRKVALIQASLNAKIAIITIYWDGKQHICWYLPPAGGGVVNL